MARPATKSELIEAATQQFTKTQQLIAALPAEQQTANFLFGAEAGKEAHWGRDKNLRDVLIHLYEWHQLLLKWAAANQQGAAQPFIPAPYNWKTYGQMNVVFWEKHQTTPYETALQMVQDSHQHVMDLIASFSNEELFEKKHFTWTGTSNLGSYCISATASHYDWAIKKIKKHSKTYK